MIGRQGHAATLDEIKKRGDLTVATEDDFRPFEFVKDGKPTGFDNELVEDLRKYVPFEIRQEIIPWTGILAGRQHGQIRYRNDGCDHHQRNESSRWTSQALIVDATHLLCQAQGRHSVFRPSRI